MKGYIYVSARETVPREEPFLFQKFKFRRSPIAVSSTVILQSSVFALPRGIRIQCWVQRNFVGFEEIDERQLLLGVPWESQLQFSCCMLTKARLLDWLRIVNHRKDRLL